MPSWSPDDKQLTYCQYSPESGVWIMNADGSDHRQIDAGGWGTQWSPRRNEIAYTAHNERGSVLSIYDVDKKQPRVLEHKAYQQVFWHFSWSPDGDWICFKGVLPGGDSEIAALSVEGEKKGFKVILPSTALPEVANCYETLAWGGTGKQILIRMQCKDDRANKLYILDTSGVKPPHVFPNSPAGWLPGDMAWSCDGKKVVISARAAAAPSKKPTINISGGVILENGRATVAQSRVERDVSKTEEKKTDRRTDGKGVEPALVGAWRAESISMALPDGGRKTLDGTDQPVSLIISEKTCTLRVRDTILASMSYVLDPKQDPWTIDMKSKEGEMLGICVKRGDKLEISLDDTAKGRPADFDKEKHGMVLDLRRFPGRPLVVMNADGSNVRPIVTTPDSTGSPKWSHDCSRIAFDGWHAVMGEGIGDVHVYTAKADGSDVIDLGAGAMPSWSPDDKQISYRRYGLEQGVWTMKADGSDRNLIEVAGWCSKWSPRRNQIVYNVYAPQRAVLYVYDVATKQRRELEHKPYRQIYWNFDWSPDGDWICFKADLPDGGCEIAALSVEGEKKGFKVILPSTEIASCNNNVAWGGTGEQILIRMKRKDDRAEKLYILDSSGVKPPQVFPNFPAGWACGDMAWSPDGKKVVFSADPAEAPSEKVTVNSGSVGVFLGTIVDEPQSPKVNEERKPLTLDLSQFRQPVSKIYESYAGRQVIDGLPFEIGGQVRLDGKTPVAHGQGVFPDTIKGIRIGRTFDELCLIHHAMWPDVEGKAIAYFCLNYADGTKYIFPINYGVHLRDWYNLPSYEKETVTDTDTTICWRHEPVDYKAPARLFKSRFVNPSPEKVVETMDIVAARNLAAYNLVAATVANGHSAAAAPKFTGDRRFDGKIVIRVVDGTTDKPIAGALVLPVMDVLNEGVVGSPFYTSSTGRGTIPYPTADTTELSAQVEKQGYNSASQGWASSIPNTFTFRLSPVAAESR